MTQDQIFHVKNQPHHREDKKYVHEQSWPLGYHTNKYDTETDKRKLNAIAVKLMWFQSLHRPEVTVDIFCLLLAYVFWRTEAEEKKII